MIEVSVTDNHNLAYLACSPEAKISQIKIRIGLKIHRPTIGETRTLTHRVIKDSENAHWLNQPVSNNFVQRNFQK